MPELTEPQPGEPVEASWGDQVANRVVSRYATEAARDAAGPHEEGSVCFVLDIDSLQVFDGAWVPVQFGAVLEGVTQIRDSDGVLRISMNAGGDIALRDETGSLSFLYDQSFNRWRFFDGRQVTFSDGSAGAPGIAFDLESGTGLYRPGAGQMGIGLGGSERLLMNADRFYIKGINFYMNGADARIEMSSASMPVYEPTGNEYEVRWNGTSGLYYRGPNVSSLRALKKNIEALGLVALPEPVSFEWRTSTALEGEEPDTRTHFGFIQDELADEFKESEASPDYRALLAAAVAHIHDLTARVEALESA